MAWPTVRCMGLIVTGGPFMWRQTRMLAPLRLMGHIRWTPGLGPAPPFPTPIDPSNPCPVNARFWPTADANASGPNRVGLLLPAQTLV